MIEKVMLMLRWLLRTVATPLVLIFVLSGFQNLRVVDGDTIHIDGVKYRIHGIDAPERNQKCFSGGKGWLCGVEATREMRRLATGAINCTPIEKDRYGRVVAKCFADGLDIGRELVRKGLALAYRRYSGDYIPDEDFARENRLGVWSGEFTVPWEWRRQ